ncbi:MAG TPA: ligand-binding protein SH3 [Candidatus Portnoybacteria bacterium]|nr:ligand-binding protein SH3 [Candidatus Portnoybacteria bacterium]
MIQNLPPELLTLIMAMLPIVELRGAIPVALGVYHLSWPAAFGWAVLGNLIPVIFLLYLLDPLSRYLSHHFYFFNRFFIWLFEGTRRRHNHRFELLGALALITLVAVPLPMTGGWTGALVAFVFGIPFKKALPLIGLGILIAGTITTLISLSLFT